jgi:hypothetical protein
MPDTHKEQLADIQGRHSFTTEGLAVEAGVSATVVSHMLEGVPVLRSEATRVLSTLSRLMGDDSAYSLDNVKIAVAPDASFQSEVARILAQIDTETEAMMRGLYGLAEGTSRHEVITAKWDTVISRHYDQLTSTDNATP